MKKKVAFFYTAWTDSGERLLEAAKSSNLELVPIHHTQVVFEGKRKEFEAKFSQKSLRDFGLFYFRSVGDKNESLPLLLEYAKKHQIGVVDEYLLGLGGAMRKRKSSEAMMLLQAGVSYPETVFVANKQELLDIVSQREKPLIVKSTKGSHGTGTFLIKEEGQLERVLLGRERQNFMIQEYIPNDGDYRLFLIGYKVVAGFKRQRKEEKLILNRSVGASNPLKKIPEDIAWEAQKAARVLGVQIAGIDLVKDERTGKPVVIEVNQSPEFYVMERRTGKNIASEIIRFLQEKIEKK